MKPLLVLFAVLTLAEGFADSQEKVPEYLVGSWSGEGATGGPNAYPLTITFRADGTWESRVVATVRSGRVRRGTISASGTFRIEPSGEILLEGKNEADDFEGFYVGKKVQYRLKRVGGKLGGVVTGPAGEAKAMLTKDK